MTSDSEFKRRFTGSLTPSHTHPLTQELTYVAPDLEAQDMDLEMQAQEKDVEGSGHMLHKMSAARPEAEGRQLGVR